MTTKPPECPSCGCAKVVPVVRGLPTEEAEVAAREGGRAVIGGSSVMGDGLDPEWSCWKCERTFGGVSSPRTAATWRAVVRTMLPAPVKDSEARIVGGDPGEVVVKISDGGIEIGVYRSEWGASGTEVVIKDWKHRPIDAKPAAVSRAIQAARARRIRTYQWCSLCHEVKPPDDIERGTCYACQERNGWIF